MRRFLRGLLALAVLPLALTAQGTLSGQGYGYPTGQLGATAAGTGGASAEIDPGTPLNPAVLSAGSRYSIFMQVEPESRRTSLADGRASTRVVRFPVFSASGALGRVVVGASFSTFLDRTFSNTYADSQVVAGVTLPSTLTAASNGAITDARFAVAYQVRPRIHLGAALHSFVGENRLTFGRTFPDSSGIGGVQQSSVMNYGGRALSVGVIVVPVDGLLIGLSARSSGPLVARQDELKAAEADVPTRVGIGASWIGIPNTTLSARFERTRWSRMDALGTSAMTTFDASDLGVGVEVVGPKVGGLPSILRLGLRDRTLPFGVGTAQVAERAISGGMGIPVSRGRGQIELAAQRADRSAAGGASERGWIVSIGLGIRP
jgi:hypothetical protein